MTTVVRQVENYQLIKDVMGNHRLVDTNKLNNKNEDGLSVWLDSETVETLKETTQEDFTILAIGYINI